MVLAALVGFALQEVLGWRDAAVTGALLGMLASLFVPRRPAT